MELFIDNCLRLLEDRIEKLRPEVFLRSMENFEEAKLRQRYVTSLMKALRENKFDIRRFNFVQLSKLVQLVAQYQKADLHVFFRYVLSCVEQEYFPKKVLREQFTSFSRLFHMFVREGFISAETPTRLYFSYVLTLKEKMETEGGAKAVSFDEIVHLLWALMATEDEVMQNPLIPRLLERLHEFKRPESPLSKDELLELHQVNVLV